MNQWVEIVVPGFERAFRYGGAGTIQLTVVKIVAPNGRVRWSWVASIPRSKGSNGSCSTLDQAIEEAERFAGLRE